jgi:hypothetical protein
MGAGSPNRRNVPLVSRTSTVCGPDPEPNLYPTPHGMEPAGHPHRKVAKRKTPATHRIESLVRRMSTMCELDPEPNLQPKSRAMEPAGHSHWKVAKRTKHGAVNERSPKKRAHWLIVVRGLDQARSLIRRSTTPHPIARSHPRPTYGCRSKGDQPAPGCRLGVEGPKDGEIKEKAKRDQAKSGP